MACMKYNLDIVLAFGSYYYLYLMMWYRSPLESTVFPLAYVSDFFCVCYIQVDDMFMRFLQNGATLQTTFPCLLLVWRHLCVRVLCKDISPDLCNIQPDSERRDVLAYTTNTGGLFVMSLVMITGTLMSSLISWILCPPEDLRPWYSISTPLDDLAYCFELSVEVVAEEKRASVSVDWVVRVPVARRSLSDLIFLMCGSSESWARYEIVSCLAQYRLLVSGC